MKTLLRVYWEAVEPLLKEFTQGELCMMLDVMNGTPVTGAVVGWRLLVNVEKAFQKNPGIYQKKWGIEDSAAMIKKLKDLPPVNTIFLEIWANSFGRQVENTDSGDLMGYIAKVPMFESQYDEAMKHLDAAIQLQLRSAGSGELIKEACEHSQKAKDLLEKL